MHRADRKRNLDVFGLKAAMEPLDELMAIADEAHPQQTLRDQRPAGGDEITK